MKKPLLKALAVATTALTLSGCMGHMATAGLVTKLNLSVVDNRFARAGLFVLLTPVYGFAAGIDYFVINTIEFWSGTNPFNGKRALTRTRMNTLINVSAIEEQNPNIESATYKQLDENTLEMHLTYKNGEEVTIMGVKDAEVVHFHINGELVSSAPVSELNAYVAAR